MSSSENLFEEMLEWVGFGEAEAAALSALAERIRPNLHGIVEAFYDRVEANPATRGVVEEHSSRERLSSTMRQWLLEFLTGPHDQAYYQRRCRIGMTHVRIGLPPHYVFTAMNVLREGLRPLATAEEQRAINGLMDVELGIINQVYWDDVTGNLQRTERLATIGELAGSFAHEIRNPLGALQNAAFFIRGKVRSADTRVAKHLDVMQRKIEECERLVATLLEFARAREPIARQVPLATLLREAVADATLTPDVTVTISGMDTATVKGDEVQLRALFRNLLTNAAQAMGGRGTIDIRVEADDEQVRVHVSDDGPGVSDEVQGRIFRPLVTTKNFGLGLGLPYCQRVAKAHGGQLIVQSEPDQGATFTLEVPR